MYNYMRVWKRIESVYHAKSKHSTVHEEVEAMVPSGSYIGGERGRALRSLDVVACGRWGIRTAGEAGQPGQRAAQRRRVRRAVLRVHYHVDDRVHARARVQQQVARDVEHWSIPSSSLIFYVKFTYYCCFVIEKLYG